MAFEPTWVALRPLGLVERSFRHIFPSEEHDFPEENYVETALWGLLRSPRFWSFELPTVGNSVLNFELMVSTQPQFVGSTCEPFRDCFRPSAASILRQS